ncbi:hypothetical protein D9V32_00245 [Mycetocola tolaasinivorans]|uniref:Uncharacterized protein n=1 Tax=Mycetocola tolaasinivorans TaxID=76635 RepID=A0A3L7ADS5_9MICO|nr:hypothetical protein [Mycetocola tolaasinivorans]RLP77801.1 hypothetical protein D9V32_00245 [Mycetocola tolaasinivorans]
MNETTIDSPQNPGGDSRGFGLSRRTLVAGAAWSVPAIALISASPAAATSGESVWELETPEPWLGVVDRCATVTPGHVRFSVTENGTVPSEEQTITVTLSEGISFSRAVPGQEQEQQFRTIGGTIRLPGIDASGTSGYYSITATVRGLTSTVLMGIVGTAPGAVFTFNTGASQEPSMVPHTEFRAKTAAVARNAHWAVDDRSMLWYWGQAFGGGAKRIATIDGAVTAVSGWSSQPGSQYFTGCLVLTEDNRVFRGLGTGGSLSFTELTSFRGVVDQIVACDNAYYVLTDEGLWHGGGAFKDSSNTAQLVGPYRPSAGASKLTAWSTYTDKWYTGGGIEMANGQINTFRANSNNTIYSASRTSVLGNVHTLFATDTSIIVMNDKREVFGAGDAFGGPNNLVFIAQNAVEVAAWGIRSGGNEKAYTGGVILVENGSIIEFLQEDGKSMKSKIVPGELENVTRVFAADGSYLALDANGSVFRWTGNADSTITKPSKVAVPAMTDIFHYGYHTPNWWAGYVVGIAADVCTF